MAEGGNGRRLAGDGNFSHSCRWRVQRRRSGRVAKATDSAAADAPLDPQSPGVIVGGATHRPGCHLGTPAGRRHRLGPRPGSVAATLAAPRNRRGPAVAVDHCGDVRRHDSSRIRRHHLDHRGAGDPLSQAVGRDAVAPDRLSVAAGTEGWTIQFLPGRPGLLGGTWTYEKRIKIYVRTADRRRSGLHGGARTRPRGRCNPLRRREASEVAFGSGGSPRTRPGGWRAERRTSRVARGTGQRRSRCGRSGAPANRVSAGSRRAAELAAVAQLAS